MCRSVLQCVAVSCSVAVCCIVSRVSIYSRCPPGPAQVTACCSLLQRVAARYIMLQRVAVCSDQLHLHYQILRLWVWFTHTHTHTLLSNYLSALIGVWRQGKNKQTHIHTQCSSYLLALIRIWRQGKNTHTHTHTHPYSNYLLSLIRVWRQGKNTHTHTPYSNFISSYSSSKIEKDTHTCIWSKHVSLSYILAAT